MTRVATVRQADIDRTLKALAKNGVRVESVVITPHEVTIKPALTDASSRPLTALEEARAKRAAGASARA